MEAAVKGGTAKDANGGAEKEEEEEEEQKKSIPVVSIQPVRITMIRACQDPFRTREKSVCLCRGSFVLSCAQAGQDGRGLRKEKEGGSPGMGRPLPFSLLRVRAKGGGGGGACFAFQLVSRLRREHTEAPFQFASFQKAFGADRREKRKEAEEAHGCQLVAKKVLRSYPADS